MDAKRIEEFLDGRLVLDCPKITLYPCLRAPDKKPLVGAGTIAADQPGEFLLKVFFGEAFALEDTFVSLNWEAGQVIGVEHYYNLEACDIAGIMWTSERLLPDRSVGPEGSMIKSTFRDLRHTAHGQYRTQGTTVKFYFNDLVKVPMNTVIKEETSIEGKARSLRSGLMIARFSSEGVKFEVDNHSGKTVLRADFEQSEVPRSQVNRVFEAFCFVLARTNSWSVLVRLDANEQTTWLRAVKPEPERSRIGAPLNISHHLAARYVWKLFDKYFRHITRDSDSACHPVSLLSRAVFESGKASLDVQALTLCVKVESLLTDEMKGLYAVSDELKEDISIATKLITDSEALSSSFRKRVLGSLGAMRHPRAKDLLAELEKRCLIDSAGAKTYGKLRNQMAHGSQEPNPDVQELLNQAGSVLVLFYQLVFLIVDYQGGFSEYGEYGYPIKEFSGKLAQGEKSTDDA
jgi:hypothetical protein